MKTSYAIVILGFCFLNVYCELLSLSANLCPLIVDTFSDGSFNVSLLILELCELGS